MLLFGVEKPSWRVHAVNDFWKHRGGWESIMGWRSLAEVAMELGVTGCSRSVNTSTNHCQIRNISITMLKGYFTQKTLICPHLVLNLQDWHSSMNTQQNCWRSLIGTWAAELQNTSGNWSNSCWYLMNNCVKHKRQWRHFLRIRPRNEAEYGQPPHDSKMHNAIRFSVYATSKPC